MDRVLKLVNIMNTSKIQFIKRCIHYYLRVIYSIDIMPGTKIGEGTRFPHRGLGVVINHNAVIGKNCVIEANSVIGGRHRTGNFVAPILGDGVFVGANALILGPVVVGNNSVIGGGAVVVKDVPENAVVVGNPARIIKYRTEKSKY